MFILFPPYLEKCKDNKLIKKETEDRWAIEKSTPLKEDPLPICLGDGLLVLLEE